MKTRQANLRQRRGGKAGFTLAEVLVGSALFTMVALAVALTLQHAFRVVTIARYEERASNILRVLGDQFQTSVLKESSSDTYKTLFVATSATGTGLAWSKKLQTFVYPSASSTVSGGDYIAGSAAGLVVPLSTTGDDENLAPKVTIKRRVRYVNPSTGSALADGSAAPSDSAGNLMRADFTAEFTLLGTYRFLQVTALRNLNPTDK